MEITHMFNEIIAGLSSFDLVVLAVCSICLLYAVGSIIFGIITTVMTIAVMLVSFLGRITAGIIFIVGLVVTLLYVGYVFEELELIQHTLTTTMY